MLREPARQMLGSYFDLRCYARDGLIVWRPRSEVEYSILARSRILTQPSMSCMTNFLSMSLHVALEAVEPADVDHYLQEELRLYRQRHQRVPRSMDHWRHRRTAGIYMLLRLVRKQWAPEVVGGPSEQFHRDVCEQYAGWMTDVRGLTPETSSRRCTEAERFLNWLAERGHQQTILNVTTRDIDSYLMVRAGSRRRTSIKLYATNLRSFLRFLYISGRVKLDLSPVVIGRSCMHSKAFRQL